MSDLIAPVSSDSEVTVVESLCMQCHSQGVTRLLMCAIPFFKEIVVSSFECEQCGYTNNDVQSVGSLAENGVHFEFIVRTPHHLSRDIVKSEYATLTLPDIGFEIPPSSDKAVYTNIEGILTRAYEDLEMFQPQRMEADPETAGKVATVIDRLKAMTSGALLPFVVVMDDPSGNSHIAHDLVRFPSFEQDPDLHLRRFKRTREQLIDMGYAMDMEEEPLVAEMEQMHVHEELPALSAHNVDFGLPIDEDKTQKDGPVEFPVECYSCGRTGSTTMCVTQIPHFKETVIMGFRCDYCGASSTEVKGGGGISPKGMKVSLRVTGQADLRRDVIKSDTAVVRIPEIGLELMAGTLGGLVTTVEGLVDKIECELLQHAPSALGDSLTSVEAENFRNFKRRLEDFRTRVSEPYTLVLDDPLANSYVAKLSDEDQQVTMEEYERTDEQNDDLGLTDMRV